MQNLRLLQPKPINIHCEMNSIRPKGQLSIPSTFIFSTSNRLNDCDKDPEIKSLNEKGSRISLTDFLNKKLHGSSVLPGSVQGNAQPFSSPVADQEVDKSSKDKRGEKGKTDGKISAYLSIAMMEQFKKTEGMVKDNICSVDDEHRSLTLEDSGQSSRKRRRGAVASQPPRKVLAVLGDDSGADRRAKARKHASEKKPRPLYNHYANGGGWWDCDMEGVDNEEVGCNEVWEGVGTTTLGGLDFH